MTSGNGAYSENQLPHRWALETFSKMSRAVAAPKAKMRRALTEAYRQIIADGEQQGVPLSGAFRWAKNTAG
jgi:hypothetical protein